MFSVERLGDTTIVRVTGDLDISISPGLGSILALVQSAKSRRIVVSLEGCNFCDASGLSVLLRAHKAATADFTVVVPDGAKCRRVFDITDLCKVFHLVPTLQSAFATNLAVAV